MVEKGRLFSRHSAERELPSWAQDIKVSYDACCQMRDRIVKELGTAESSWDSAEELAGQLKKRILNLRDSIEARQFKFPKYIMVDIPSVIPDDNRQVFFLPRAGRLVLVPQVEKIVVFKPKQVPDFSKAQDAPERQWISAGFLAVQLLNPIPSKRIRDQIMKEEW